MNSRIFLAAVAACCLPVAASAQQQPPYFPPQQFNILPGVSITARCVQNSNVENSGSARRNRSRTSQEIETLPMMRTEPDGLKVYCQNNQPIVFRLQSFISEESWRAREKWGQPLPVGHAEYFKVICPSYSILITMPARLHETSAWEIGCRDKTFRLTAHTSMLLG